MATNKIISGTSASTIPAGASEEITLGEYAFMGCNLSSIVIPTSVVNLMEGAFYECAELKTVYFGGSNLIDWMDITRTPYNEILDNVVICYCSESEPTTSGYYWRYVNGVPTVWEETTVGE